MAYFLVGFAKVEHFPLQIASFSGPLTSTSELGTTYVVGVAGFGNSQFCTMGESCFVNVTEALPWIAETMGQDKDMCVP